MGGIPIVYGMIEFTHDRSQKSGVDFDQKYLYIDMWILKLSISDRTYRSWTSDKQKQIKEERNQRILDLHLQCWTQERIAEEIGDITHQGISKIIDGFATNGNIAESCKDFKPQLYNIWNFAKITNESFLAYPVMSIVAAAFLISPSITAAALCKYSFWR